jgi:quercetin dioxygenase-like cupin family protein
VSGFTVKAIDEMATLHDGLLKLAGAELGVESFGMQVFDFPGGFADYPEHDHLAEGQQEIYIVLRGSAEVEVDGERVAIDAGRMLSLAPATRRKLHPGPDGVRLLALGCTPGRLYERPAAFRLPEGG